MTLLAKNIDSFFITKLMNLYYLSECKGNSTNIKVKAKKSQRPPKKNHPNALLGTPTSNIASENVNWWEGVDTM